MSTPTVAAPLVVLDAHGVVFDRAFPAFVRRRAVERGEDPTAVWGRWRDRHRLDFWEGRTTPTEMWAGLFPGDCPARLTAELERTYRPGPLFRYVATGSQRLWLLSNHRSGWLLPRLERFGIADRFERVLVSDREGVAKPDPAAFEPLRRIADDVAVCVLDDSLTNVQVARSVGLVAHHLDQGAAAHGAAATPVEPCHHPASDHPSRRRT
jgi:FMN phosphatase YigB (HAD superfamily)